MSASTESAQALDGLSFSRRVCVTWLVPKSLLEIVSIPIVFLPVAIKVLASSLPMGYAGLYTLMANLISTDPHHLPQEIPFYGPGGTPFAYPPLALDAMALALHALPISAFTYLRVAPLVFALLYLPILYFSLRELLESKSMALIATLLVVGNPDFLIYHVFSDGVVRGFALIWTLAGLWIALKAFESCTLPRLAVASVCFALTLISHPSNPIFFAVTLAIFGLMRGQFFRALRILAGIVAGGILLASPWLLFVVNRFGSAVFSSALHSHQGAAETSLGGLIFNPLQLIAEIITRALPTTWALAPMYVCCLVGIVFSLKRRQFVLPTWWAATLLLIPDGRRFWAITTSVLATYLAFEVRPKLVHKWHPISKLSFSHVVLIITAYAAFCSTHWVLGQSSYLDDHSLSMASWVRLHTSQNATVLVASQSLGGAEWFPYLLQRNPVVAPWGGEWTGSFERQQVLFAQQAECLQRQSTSCLDSFILTNDLHPDFLVLPQTTGRIQLIRSLVAMGSWSLVYRNQSSAVWLRSPTALKPALRS